MHLDRPTKGIERGFACALSLCQERKSNNPLRILLSVTPSKRRSGHGILTVCPSPSAFAIGLGPTNPQLIVIAAETLGFRRAGISPALWLLVPTFSLPSAPVALAGQPSLLLGMLSYYAAHSAEAPISKYSSSKQIPNYQSPSSKRCRLKFWICNLRFVWKLVFWKLEIPCYARHP